MHDNNIKYTNTFYCAFEFIFLWFMNFLLFFILWIFFIRLFHLQTWIRVIIKFSLSLCEDISISFLLNLNSTWKIVHPLWFLIFKIIPNNWNSEFFQLKSLHFILHESLDFFKRIFAFCIEYLNHCIMWWNHPIFCLVGWCIYWKGVSC